MANPLIAIALLAWIAIGIRIHFLAITRLIRACYGSMRRQVLRKRMLLLHLGPLLPKSKRLWAATQVMREEKRRLAELLASTSNFENRRSAAIMWQLVCWWLATFMFLVAAV